MVTVSEALDLVLEQAEPLQQKVFPLSAAVLGHVLAEDIVSDLDMPPYTKALMDGYAVRATDVAAGIRDFTVVEEITAGKIPSVQVGRGQASRIMTGAPLPRGANAVVVVERTRMIGDDRVELAEKSVKEGLNVLAQGTEMRRGDVVLTEGSFLRPQELGLLATVGRTEAALYPSPQVALLATGDELVEARNKPETGKIRNSNGPMLAAQVARAGGVPRLLGIAADRVDVLTPMVADGLKSDVLLLSGGVSAGKLDLVPGVLHALGVKPYFHKVEIKPGKPIFFGTRQKTLVFGLPGNPASTLVCFELFVRPALRRLRGEKNPGPFYYEASLAEDFFYDTDRPTYYPASLQRDANEWRARPVSWFGSADLRSLIRADGFVVITPGSHHFRAGQRMTILRMED